MPNPQSPIPNPLTQLKSSISNSMITKLSFKHLSFLRTSSFSRLAQIKARNEELRLNYLNNHSPSSFDLADASRICLNKFDSSLFSKIESDAKTLIPQMTELDLQTLNKLLIHHQPSDSSLLSLARSRTSELSPSEELSEEQKKWLSKIQFNYYDDFFANLLVRRANFLEKFKSFGIGFK